MTDKEYDHTNNKMNKGEWRRAPFYSFWKSNLTRRIAMLVVGLISFALIFSIILKKAPISFSEGITLAIMGWTVYKLFIALVLSFFITFIFYRSLLYKDNTCCEKCFGLYDYFDLREQCLDGLCPHCGGSQFQIAIITGGGTRKTGWKERTTTLNYTIIKNLTLNDIAPLANQVATPGRIISACGTLSMEIKFPDRAKFIATKAKNF